MYFQTAVAWRDDNDWLRKELRSECVKNQQTSDVGDQKRQNLSGFPYFESFLKPLTSQSKLYFQTAVAWRDDDDWLRKELRSEWVNQQTSDVGDQKYQLFSDVNDQKRQLFWWILETFQP